LWTNTLQHSTVQRNTAQYVTADRLARAISKPPNFLHKNDPAACSRSVCVVSDTGSCTPRSQARTARYPPPPPGPTQHQFTLPHGTVLQQCHCMLARWITTQVAPVTDPPPSTPCAHTTTRTLLCPLLLTNTHFASLNCFSSSAKRVNTPAAGAASDIKPAANSRLATDSTRLQGKGGGRMAGDAQVCQQVECIQGAH
jgi:hypothetical protein